VKPLYLIRHARNKVRHWRIPFEDIEQAVLRPEATRPSIENRVNYWRRWRNAWLRVTVVEEADRIVVITVTPKEKGPEAEQ
jgi:hypothetical protein